MDSEVVWVKAQNQNHFLMMVRKVKINQIKAYFLYKKNKKLM